MCAMCNVEVAMCATCNVCNLLFAMCATSANKRAAWKTSRFGPRRSQHSWKRGFTTRFIFDIESEKSDKNATNTEQSHRNNRSKELHKRSGPWQSQHSCKRLPGCQLPPDINVLREKLEHVQVQKKPACTFCLGLSQHSNRKGADTWKHHQKNKNQNRSKRYIWSETKSKLLQHDTG